MITNEIVSPYIRRKGYLTILAGADPKEATINFINNFDDSTAFCDMDDLFDTSIYKHGETDNNKLYISPFSYRTNSRKKDNFKEMSFLALDFDDGLSIVELQSLLGKVKLAHAIYTTKSHQVKKIMHSGKEHHACDRYRCFIPISESIKTSKSLFQFFHAIKAIYPFSEADKACFESARIFNVYPYGKVFINKAKNCLNVEQLIEMGKDSIHKVTAGNHKKYESIDDKQLIFNENEKADENLIKSMNEYYKNTEWKIENTHQKIFGCICAAFNRNSNWSTVYKSIQEWNIYKEWLTRHPNQKCESKKLVSKCFNLVYGVDIQAKNPTHPYDEKELFISLDYADNCLKLRQHRNMSKEISSTDMLLEKAMNDDVKRIIIQSPCGGGKSTAAMSYMATYASSTNPVWYIAETRDLCEKFKYELDEVYKSNVGYLSGFNPAQCTKVEYMQLPDGEGYHIEGIWSTREAYKHDFCKGCYDRDTCHFFKSRHETKTILDKQCVVMTHKKLINLIQREEVPPHVSLIIDEELKRWENFSFTQNHFNTFERKFSKYDKWDDVGLASEYKTFMDDLKNIMEESANTYGVELEYFSISPQLRKHLLKILNSEESEELLNHNDMNQYYVADKYDKLNEFVSFFSNDSIKYIRHSIQSIKDSEVEIWDCATDAIQFLIPNKTIILNASAQYSHVKWEEFVIYKLNEKVEVPNTTFHCLLANPTKRRIMKGGKNQKPLIDSILNQADMLIKEKNIKEVFIATDKVYLNNKIDDFISKHTKRKHNVVQIARGNIQSNNLARNSEIAVVTMANFTTLSNYLLMSAMASEERIDADRFLTQNGSTKMHRGFDDEAIDEEATRQMVDEIYQTVMRGCIRSDSTNRYDIIVVLTPKLLIELMKLFPNAKFESVDKDLNAIIEMNQMSDDGINNLSKKDKDKIFNYSTSSKNRRKRNNIIKLVNQLKVQRNTNKS